MNRSVWFLGIVLMIGLLATRAQAGASGTMTVTAQNAPAYGFTVGCRQEGELTFFHADMHFHQRLSTDEGRIVRVCRAGVKGSNVFWVRSDSSAGGGNASQRSAASRPSFQKFSAMRVNTVVPHPTRGGGVSFDFAVPTQGLDLTGFVIDVSYDMPSVTEYWIDLKSWRSVK